MMEAMFRQILAEARREKVTDLLFKEGEPLYMRFQDELQQQEVIIPRELMDWLFHCLNTTERVREGTQGLDTDAAFEENGRYRINCFTSEGRQCACIRIINNDLPSLGRLGVDERLPDQIHERRGLSLVVGKTGSGKSTTMAGIITAILKKWAWHIITLEDPIEYRLDKGRGLVTQRELGGDFLSFREGMRSALRQSPDLIMIGEVRDCASLRAVLEAAESGTGVIATLHSLGAANTISRMLQMFPAEERDFVRFQLAGNLNFIQSQILIRHEMGLKLDYELILGTPAVKNTIAEGNLNQLKNLILLGRKQGMRGFSSGSLD